jgi:hypothetical protein
VVSISTVALLALLVVLGSPSPDTLAAPAALSVSEVDPSAQDTSTASNVTLNLTPTTIWGEVAPGAVVTATRLSDDAYGAAETDGVGFFWTPLWQSNGRPADIVDGDTIEIYVDGALATTISPHTITGEVDVVADQVNGTISGVGAGVPVTVTLGVLSSSPLVAEDMPGDYMPHVTATTDAAGHFSADFGAAGYDVGPHNHAIAAFDAGATLQSYLYPQHVFQIRDLSAVVGYATPGQVVTVTVESSTPVTTVAWVYHGDYNLPVEVAAGDTVAVDLGGGTVISTVARALTTHPDAALDQATGTCPPNAVVRAYTHFEPLRKYAETTTTADASGHYTAAFGAHDLLEDETVVVAIADAEGDEVALTSYPPAIGAYLFPYFNGVWGAGDGPRRPFTATLYHAPDTYIQTGTTGLDNQFAANFAVDIAAGDQVTVETPGWSQTMTVADVSVFFNTANDQVQGEADIPGWVLVDCRQWQERRYPIRGTGYATATVTSPFTAAFDAFDVRDGGVTYVKHHDANGSITMRQHKMPFFRAIVGDVLEGIPPSAHEVVTASLYANDGTTLLSQTSDDEDSDPLRFRFNFGTHRIEPGRWVTITSQSGWEAGIHIPELTIHADPESDLIWGDGPKVLVWVMHGYNDGMNWSTHVVPVDGYVVDQAYFGIDIQPEDDLGLRYQAPNGNRVWKGHDWTWMYANDTYERVGGIYEVGHTFWVTATRGDTVKATAVVTTEGAGADQDGEFRDGFTVWAQDWIPAHPDIESGDTILFRSDDGYTHTLRIGTLTGWLVPQDDTAEGSVEAPWLASQTVDVIVGDWGFAFAEDDVELDAMGEGEYVVHFPSSDVLTDTTLKACYQEPDLDRVYIEIAPVRRTYLPLVLRSYAP